MSKSSILDELHSPLYYAGRETIKKKETPTRFYKEPKKYEIFNVTDNYPCSYKEVVEYGCKILNIKKPKVFSFEETSNSNLKIFYKDSKKVSNEKVKKFLNYKLKFPSYIEGLNYIRDNFI